jgi:hypothetical protein
MTRVILGVGILLVLAFGSCIAFAEEGAAPDTLEHLVPELKDNNYSLEPGPRRFKNRLSLSPAVGRLGAEPVFTLRIAYNPSSWLGWEGALGHNPGEAVHAVLHNVSAVVRKPLAGRVQPYLKGGYGMMMVYPGPSLNADPVTKNALTVGGGLEFYIRDDVAIRAESQLATILGSERDRDGTVAYNYWMNTIGFTFYRTIGP